MKYFKFSFFFFLLIWVVCGLLAIIQWIQLFGIGIFYNWAMIGMRNEDSKFFKEVFTCRSTDMGILEIAKEISKTIFEEHLFSIFCLDKDLDVDGRLNFHLILEEHFYLTHRFFQLNQKIGWKEFQELLRMIWLDFYHHILFLHICWKIHLRDVGVFLSIEIDLCERYDIAEAFNLLFNIRWVWKQDFSVNEIILDFKDINIYGINCNVTSVIIDWYIVDCRHFLLAWFVLIINCSAIQTV